MKERPIIFSAPMVRAILKGSKSQTRRVVKPIPAYPDSWDVSMFKEPQFSCPYGKPGDRLWVRETFAHIHGGHVTAYRASMVGSAWDAVERKAITWTPSIHMPRKASRLNLVVKAVRVERLQDISEADALDEGMEVVDREPDTGDPLYRDHWCDGYAWSARESFTSLWHKLHGFGKPGSWDANPWVWVVQFEQVTEVPA